MGQAVATLKQVLSRRPPHALSVVDFPDCEDSRARRSFTLQTLHRFTLSRYNTLTGLLPSLFIPAIPTNLRDKLLPSPLSPHSRLFVLCFDAANKPLVQSKISPGAKSIFQDTLYGLTWSDKLDDTLWAFRTAYKTPIGCTPYKLAYGKAFHLPVELEHKLYMERVEAPYKLYMERLVYGKACHLPGALG
ncbi:reverse transcriptase domain-containing protein [Tanacetum coccineum]